MMNRELVMLWYDGSNFIISEPDQKVPYLIKTDIGYNETHITFDIKIQIPFIKKTGMYCFRDEIEMFKEDVKQEFISQKEDLRQAIVKAVGGI